jgi:hypothetical protein
MAPVEALPEVALAPVQSPEAVQLVASVELHVRFVDAPDATDAACAARLTVGIAGVGGVTGGSTGGSTGGVTGGVTGVVGSVASPVPVPSESQAASTAEAANRMTRRADVRRTDEVSLIMAQRSTVARFRENLNRPVARPKASTAVKRSNRMSSRPPPPLGFELLTGASLG